MFLVWFFHCRRLFTLRYRSGPCILHRLADDHKSIGKVTIIPTIINSMRWLDENSLNR